MKHASLFSGIGGFDLAAQSVGFENVFHCEINTFCQKTLKYYWPNAQTYQDIKTTDFAIWRGQIDILSGGFPCQPFSSAGLRKGTEDERHLWPEMLRAIREIKPRFIVGENVSGLLTWNDGMVFRQVLADLENEGYEVQAFIIPACAVGAPHKRDRVWIIANSNDNREVRASGFNARPIRKEWIQKRNEIQRAFKSDSLRGFTTNAACWWARKLRNQIEASGTRESNELLRSSYRIQDKKYNASNAFSLGFARKEYRTKKSGFNMQNCKGINWNDFPTQPPICGGNDGIPSKLDGITFSKWRNESIKGYGNAIVPQIAQRIFEAIKQSHEYTT